MMKLLLLVVLSSAAYAQLSLGLKGGIVRTENASPPLTGGAYAELKIPFVASVESGILFKRYAFPGEKRAAYEVPILLKKRIGPFPVQPFLSAGLTLHKRSDADLRRGLTLGGGMSFNALLVKIEPELRYTRYGSGVLPVGRNQVEVLFGFRF